MKSKTSRTSGWAVLGVWVFAVACWFALFAVAGWARELCR